MRGARSGQRKVRLVQNHAIYAAMVEQMDRAVGRVLSAIDRAGLAERTIVVFTSDNGGLSTSEGHPTSNVPLRAGKGWPYEGGIRVPLIIDAPGVTRPGSVCHTPVITTDFYPTLLELTGLPAAPEQHLDGVSLVPLLKGGELGRRTLFWHYPHYGNQGGAPCGFIRDGDWKLIEWYEDSGRELYNLRDDPGEQHDLAAANPEKVRDLAARLDAWRAEVKAVMPRPNPGPCTFVSNAIRLKVTTDFGTSFRSISGLRRGRQLSLPQRQNQTLTNDLRGAPVASMCRASDGRNAKL